MTMSPWGHRDDIGPAELQRELDYWARVASDIGWQVMFVPSVGSGLAGACIPSERLIMVSTSGMTMTQICAALHHELCHAVNIPAPDRRDLGLSCAGNVRVERTGDPRRRR